jgi:hypothetical protein
MISENELRQKRTMVGLLAIGSTIAACVLLVIGGSQGFASALLRVGLLLGAFWLALPTKDRPAAWARVSPWSLGVIIGVALVLPRLRFFLPVLVVGVLIGWIVRPRRGKRK